MIKMSSPKFMIRMPPALKVWIETRARDHGRSMNGQIVNILNDKMKEDPLRIFVTTCDLDGRVFYTASIGVAGDDFYEGPLLEEAIAAAKSKAKELGLPRSAIVFEAINDRREALTDGAPNAGR